MTVKRLKELLQKFDEQTEIIFEFTHIKNPVIAGSIEKFSTDQAVIINAVNQDGHIYIVMKDK